MICAAVMSGSLTGGVAPNTPPVANWTVSNFNPQVGNTIQFTDESANSPSSWAWYSNGVLFSNIQNPTLYCSVSGPLSIQLTATNYFGSDSYTNTVNVQP